MKRQEIHPRALKLNLFSDELLRGALLCAGTIHDANCMTISWASMGVLWNKNIFVVYVRPTRYTYTFMEKANDFTVNFFEEKYNKVLTFCGTRSGKNVDKFRECNLTRIKSHHIQSPGIDESHLIIECQKIYFQDIVPDHFLDPDIDSLYPRKDYHRIYIGEIQRIYGVEQFIDPDFNRP